MVEGSVLAGVDLGSNSFRLEIGRFTGGHIERVDYLKETVRQGNGLDENRCLSAAAMARGVACLARFGERLRGFSPQYVRAVATQTLREARNRDEFLLMARAALGFQIEVVSGQEEARLIYQGVSHLLPHVDEQRLVIDIGGRSTELILGRGYQSNACASYRLGSVDWSMKYFADGALNEGSLRRAKVAAKSSIEPALETFARSAWTNAYGASGTVGAVADILSASGFETGAITRDGVEWMLRQMVRAQHIDQLSLPGLKEDRKGVIAGGVSVLAAAMEVLSIDVIQVAKGALRHGLLYDMVYRDGSTREDVRTDSVSRLALRFGADRRQADRVAHWACQLFSQAFPGLSPDGSSLRKLRWACGVHEIGCAVSSVDHNKHGAYIIANSDMPGFAESELRKLGQLVLCQSGKLKKLVDPIADDHFFGQVLCIRLAVIICHHRMDPTIGKLQLSIHGGAKLWVPEGFGREFPQTLHLLQEECAAWEKTDRTLSLWGDTSS